MAKITRLPSGSYHAQVYAGKDEQGKRKYKSFTADTPKEVKRLAALYELQREKQSKPTALTLEQAMYNYTEKFINILSPTTIRSYDYIRRSHFQDIIKVPLANITSDMVEDSINDMAEDLAPKTIRNAYGFLRAVMAEYRPDYRLDIKLPKAEKTVINIPSEEEMQDIFDVFKGSEMEIPVMLGACLGLRRSEILGLTWENINMIKRTLTVRQVIVYDKENEQVEKAPKSYAGTRTLAIPNKLYKRLEAVPISERSGRITQLEGYRITERFYRVLKQNGIAHYRFHDLRHYFASVMCALGIPQKYAAQRMGHSNEQMIQRVYAHVFETKANEHTEKLNEYFG